MIKKLRKKFIIIAMLSTFFVLFTIIAIINLVNFSHIIDNSEKVLNMLIENNGKFPDFQTKPMPNNSSFSSSSNSQTAPSAITDSEVDVKPFAYEIKDDFFKQSINEETPFESRYFTVILDENNECVQVNTANVVRITMQEAIRYAETLAKNNKTSGFYDSYRFAVLNTDSGNMYIFLDCSRDLTYFLSFLRLSLIISISGLVAVFILVVIFSKLALSPVEESLIKQKSFITNAGHDIKTPLTIISADTELIEMEGGANRWTEDIHAQIERLKKLTEKLVFLSKMEEEDIHIQKIDFSLSDAVSETCEEFVSVAEKTNKAIVVEVEKQISYCGDESMLRQMLSLLIDNAIKYSTEEKIQVRLKRQQKQCELIIKNACENIEVGNHNELFDRFYRGEKSRNSQTGGNGIGLSVVKAIVFAHNGKITAKSDDGKSLSLIITL